MVKKNIKIERYSDLLRSEFVACHGVYIYGAGVSGRLISEFLSSQGVRILGYLDKNFELLGGLLDHKVFSPDHVINLSETDFLVVSGNPSTRLDILRNLDSLSNSARCVDGLSILEIGKETLCAENATSSSGNRVSFKDCAVCYNSETSCRGFLEKCNSMGLIKKHEGAVFPLIGYILGQKCTLNCEHCCEGVPYITKPSISDAGSIIRDIDLLSENAAFIGRLEFIGGEPFLNKALPEVIDYALTKNNIGYVLIFTNGTVMPSQEIINQLTRERVVVNFSAYKKTVSNKLQEIIARVKNILDDNKVDLTVYNPDARSWFDGNFFSHRGASEVQLENYYQECFMGGCRRVFEGVLYLCPHQYTGRQLGLLKEIQGEQVFLNSSNLRQELIDIQRLRAPSTCQYCNLPFNAQEVSPAIQISAKAAKYYIFK